MRSGVKEKTQNHSIKRQEALCQEKNWTGKKTERGRQCSGTKPKASFLQHSPNYLEANSALPSTK